MRPGGVLIDRCPLAGVVFEFVAALARADAPPRRGLFDTAALPAHLVLLLPVLVVVRGVDQCHRQFVRLGTADPVPPAGKRL